MTSKNINKGNKPGPRPFSYHEIPFNLHLKAVRVIDEILDGDDKDRALDAAKWALDKRIAKAGPLPIGNIETLLPDIDYTKKFTHEDALKCHAMVYNEAAKGRIAMESVPLYCSQINAMVDIVSEIHKRDMVISENSQNF